MLKAGAGGLPITSANVSAVIPLARSHVTSATTSNRKIRFYDCHLQALDRVPPSPQFVEGFYFFRFCHCAIGAAYHLT